MFGCFLYLCNFLILFFPLFLLLLFPCTFLHDTYLQDSLGIVKNSLSGCGLFRQHVLNMWRGGEESTGTSGPGPQAPSSLLSCGS